MTHLLGHMPSGAEPQLGGEVTARLTGFEPLLGGTHRAQADASRVEALLNVPSLERRMAILNYVIGLGQQEVYAHDLALTIPAWARRKHSDWRGTFTPSQRCRAIEALALIGSYESILPLLEALNDSIFQVRLAAGDALTAICSRLPPDDPRTRLVFSVLIHTLRTLPITGRKIVARILSKAPAELVLGPLLRDGLTAGEWWARRETAWILGELGDRRATRRLIAALTDPSAAVRQAAAWALGRLDAPIAIPALIRAAQDDDEVVRAAAVTALGAQAARLSTLDEDFSPTLQRLVGALNDSDPAVREAALEAIDGLNRPEARLALQIALKRYAQKRDSSASVCQSIGHQKHLTQKE